MFCISRYLEQTKSAKKVQIIDVDFELIRRIKTTTAFVDDNQFAQSMESEVTYKDKGYFGVNLRGYNATIQRGVRRHIPRHQICTQKQTN